ncbi:MAG TPA: sel1 repeat family protein [Sulfurimonas sp.]|nr:sel1 repeat family protein [Sulfurimonas sp.]
MKAQYYLLELYANSKVFKTDSKKSLYYLKEPANQGYIKSEYELGSFYTQRKALDYDKAFKYLKASAKQGYINAQYDLGLMYYEGIGTSVDKYKTYQYCFDANACGDIDTQNNLKTLC